MLVTTQWPLERAAHLTSLAWVCVLWLPESLMDLSALLLNNAKLWCFVLISLDKLLSKQLSCRGQWCPCDTTTIPYNHITLHIWHNMQHVHKFMCIVYCAHHFTLAVVDFRCHTSTMTFKAIILTMPTRCQSTRSVRGQESFPVSPGVRVIDKFFSSWIW